MRQHSAHHLSANTFLNERTNAHLEKSAGPTGHRSAALVRYGSWFEFRYRSSRRRPHRLAAHTAIHPDARGLPVCLRGGCESRRHHCLSVALLPADVRHHRVLSPLFLPQVVQDLAGGAVPVRRARLLGRAARSHLVGRASSRSPPVFGQDRRRALADPARLRAGPHELVSVEEGFRAGPEARARSS